MWNSTIKPKACKYCGSTQHASWQCFKRPRPKLPYKRLKPISDKTLYKEMVFKNQWLQRNPSDSSGHWYCYLQISPMCLKRLTIETMTLEHVLPKGSHPELKYDFDNVKPACLPCNGLKGSRVLG